MPWWTSGYLAIYLAFAAWSVRDDYLSHERPIPRVVGGIASDVLLLIPALAYWLPSVRAIAGEFIVVSFGLGVALFAVLMAVELRFVILSEASFSWREKSGLVLVSSTLVIVIMLPLLLWGFKAAVLREYVDA